MPYIKQDDRTELEPHSGRHPLNAGELNYQFTTLAINYLDYHGTSYAYINDVIGALEAAKLELYRRLVVPYEDEKIEVNGDVY